MGFSVETNIDVVIKDLRDKLSKIRKDTKRTVLNAVTLIHKQVLDNLRNGSSVKVKTGALLNSISSEVVQDASGFTGVVKSSGVPYAAIHEFGGTTRAHRIVPRNSQALSFMQGGNRIFASGVNHPGSKIPARPYMGPAIEKRRDDILNLFGVMVAQALKE